MNGESNYHCDGRVVNLFFLIFVKKGSGRFRTMGKSYSLKPGDIFFLFPGVIHSYRTDPSDRLTLQWIGFDGYQVQWILEGLQITPNRPHHHFPENQDKSLSIKIEEIVHTKAEDVPAMYLSGLLYQLFGLLESSKGRTRPDSFENSSGLPVNSFPVERALAYIDRNILSRITIDSLANYVNMSRSSFTRLFKKETGRSPKEYMTKLQIDQARYLMESKLSVKEAALSLGFDDVFYFSRWFSKQTGLSPSSFREEYGRKRGETGPLEETII